MIPLAMKALFLLFHGFSEANGISKKICYQVKALQANGLETHLCYLTDENNTKRRMVDQTVIADYGNGWKGKVFKRTEFASIVRYATTHQIDFVYMRSDHNANPFTISMVKQLKRAGIKVVMEIPTYPYDQEYITPMMKVQLFTDRCFRKQLARQLDKIITFSNDRSIFGVPTLPISNGIDFTDIPMKQGRPKLPAELHLIGVAEIHYWHGFDRVVKGLAHYYAQHPERKVYFHLVGNLSGQRERDEILPLIAEHHLESYVILHGAQHGETLTSLFELCDIGIGSLGRHRSGITDIKTLKNREYAARGIPFIYSENDEDFEKMPYIMKFPADESPVDIEKVISFYQQVQLSPAEIRDSICFLSWDCQMKKVLDALF